MFTLKYIVASTLLLLVSSQSWGQQSFGNSNQGYGSQQPPRSSFGSGGFGAQSSSGQQGWGQSGQGVSQGSSQQGGFGGNGHSFAGSQQQGFGQSQGMGANIQGFGGSSQQGLGQSQRFQLAFAQQQQRTQQQGFQSAGFSGQNGGQGGFGGPSRFGENSGFGGQSGYGGQSSFGMGSGIGGGNSNFDGQSGFGSQSGFGGQSSFGQNRGYSSNSGFANSNGGTFVPTPPFLNNVSSSAAQDYYNIVNNKTLTTNQINEQATNWASTNGIQTEYTQYEANRTAMHTQAIQNVSDILNHLGSCMENIQSNKSSSANDRQAAFQQLQQAYPMEYTALTALQNQHEQAQYSKMTGNNGYTNGIYASYGNSNYQNNGYNNQYGNYYESSTLSTTSTKKKSTKASR